MQSQKSATLGGEEAPEVWYRLERFPTETDHEDLFDRDDRGACRTRRRRQRWNLHRWRPCQGGRPSRCWRAPRQGWRWRWWGRHGLRRREDGRRDDHGPQGSLDFAASG